MGKFETEFSFDEMYRVAYDWNGLVFDKVLDYCCKSGIFPDAANIGEVEKNISNQIQERTKSDTRIGRDTFNRWRKDGAKGPKESNTILLLDTLLPNIRFLHRPCAVSDKEVLHELYALAWEFHYWLPLAVEVDEFLFRYIAHVKEEYFHEKIYKNEKVLEQYKGIKYDIAMKDVGEDLYKCALLDSFYEEFHRIITDNEITFFHAIKHNNEMVLTVEYGDDLFLVERDVLFEHFKVILMKRQACLEEFGNNLRTLFLGGDINA